MVWRNNNNNKTWSESISISFLSCYTMVNYCGYCNTASNIFSFSCICMSFACLGKYVYITRLWTSCSTWFMINLFFRSLLCIYIYTYTYELHRSLLFDEGQASTTSRHFLLFFFFSPLRWSAEQKEYNERRTEMEKGQSD